MVMITFPDRSVVPKSGCASPQVFNIVFPNHKTTSILSLLWRL